MLTHFRLIPYVYSNIIHTHIQPTKCSLKKWYKNYHHIIIDWLAIIIIHLQANGVNFKYTLRIKSTFKSLFYIQLIKNTLRTNQYLEGPRQESFLHSQFLPAIVTTQAKPHSWTFHNDTSIYHQMTLCQTVISHSDLSP